MDFFFLFLSVHEKSWGVGGGKGLGGRYAGAVRGMKGRDCWGMGCWEGTVGERGAGGRVGGGTVGERERGAGRGRTVGKWVRECREMGEGMGSMEGTVVGKDGRRGMRGTR